MNFDLKIISILILLFLNFILFFNLRNKITIISIIIFSNLIAILFLSVSITNQDIFQEIVLLIISYIIFNIFLLTNFKNLKNKNLVEKKFINFKYIISISTIAILILLHLFFLTKTTIERSKIKNEEEILSQITNEINIEKQPKVNIKKEILQEKIRNNFLITRSSNIIIIIAFILPFLLILNSRKKYDL